MEKACKVCSCCKDVLTTEHYNKLASAKDGLQKYCKSCQSAKNKEWVAANKDSRSIYKRTYVAANSARTKEIKRKWDATNKDHRKAYRKERSAYYSERASHRRGRLLGATPSWLTEDQIEAIRLAYWLAEDLYAVSGQKYHVDHIVPLQGRNVCGLHVPWNLQILPSDINISKSNKHESS